MVRDHYFAIALHPVGNDYGDIVHLEAFGATEQRIATQGKPLPATPGVNGSHHVERVGIPTKHRTKARMGRAAAYVVGPEEKAAPVAGSGSSNCNTAEVVDWLVASVEGRPRR